jgi:uncharacterized protein with HEPN domain
MKRDEITLLDISRAAHLVLAFIQGVEKHDFLSDLKTQSSVLYQLTVMGEAVKRLSAEFRSRCPEIPWALIAGMRDQLIHAYDAVDWEEVWKTASKDVPELLNKIEPLLPSRDQFSQP